MARSLVPSALVVLTTTACTILPVSGVYSAPPSRGAVAAPTQPAAVDKNGVTLWLTPRDIRITVDGPRKEPHLHFESLVRGRYPSDKVTVNLVGSGAPS